MFQLIEVALGSAYIVYYSANLLCRTILIMILGNCQFWNRLLFEMFSKRHLRYESIFNWIIWNLWCHDCSKVFSHIPYQWINSIKRQKGRLELYRHPGDSYLVIKTCIEVVNSNVSGIRIVLFCGKTHMLLMFSLFVNSQVLEKGGWLIDKFHFWTNSVLTQASL